jgi:hypothetical protein
VTDEKSPSLVQGISSYEWRKSTIYISASSEDVDIRVRCAILPAVLDSDSAGYIKGMTNVIAYRTAAMIAFIRGGPQSKTGLTFQQWGDDAFSKVEDRLVKNDQNVHVLLLSVTTFRFGKRCGADTGSRLVLKPYSSLTINDARTFDGL